MLGLGPCKTAKVTKPGHSLSYPPGESVFGGLYEIAGLVRDLAAVGFRVRTDHDPGPTDISFLFGSDNPTRSSSSLPESELTVGCVTDLTILSHISKNHVDAILTQMPHWSTYFPFHTYVLDYTEWSEPSFNDWKTRSYRSIYGGGSRFGQRREKHREYLLDNDDLDAVYSSASELSAGARVHRKVPHRLLVEKYRMARFGLVLGDPSYEALGMVTQRPYEYMCCGCIPIFDRDYNARAVLGDAAIQVADREAFREVTKSIEGSSKMYRYQREAVAAALRDKTPRARRANVLNRLLDRLGDPTPRICDQVSKQL